MNQNTFCMAGGVARNPLVRLAKPITATIGANEHIAIVGPNGGGKSTLLKMMIGLLEPERGEVLLFGEKPLQVSYCVQAAKKTLPTSQAQLWQTVHTLKQHFLISSRRLSEL